MTELVARGVDVFSSSQIVLNLVSNGLVSYHKIYSLSMPTNVILTLLGYPLLLNYVYKDDLNTAKIKHLLR